VRVTSGSDWRDAVPFETPLSLAGAAPGDPARCAVCGPTSEPISRDELWLVKHRHPKHHNGFVRFYCADHVPAAAPAPVVERVPERAKRASAPRATRAPRPTPAAERPRAICPNCFVEVPPTGVCGSCGEVVT
jgi:hypothetical protein